MTPLERLLREIAANKALAMHKPDLWRTLDNMEQQLRAAMARKDGSNE